MMIEQEFEDRRKVWVNAHDLYLRIGGHELGLPFISLTNSRESVRLWMRAVLGPMWPLRIAAAGVELCKPENWNK